MTEQAGVLRSSDGLADAVRRLDAVARADVAEAGVASWETTNLLTVSRALVEAAAYREETRGSHWRLDFPERDDDTWARHVDVTLVDGATRLTTTPLLDPEKA